MICCEFFCTCLHNAVTLLRNSQTILSRELGVCLVLIIEFGIREL